jgi:glycosyltransferase involved in cell wall biosynthesis
MKILFVHQGAETFVKKDLEILKEKHEIREVMFRGKLAPLKVLREIFWCDVAFCWFGKLNAFFAALFGKMLGKKIIVVAGDDDVTSAVVGGKPYGLCSHPLKKYFAFYIFSVADMVLPVSEYSYAETIANAKADPKRVKTILHGFDSNFFRRQGSINKSPVVATIASINEEYYHRKGLRLFANAAKKFPDVDFIIIGPILDSGIARLLLQDASPNFKLVGPHFGQALVDLLSSVSVYIQASEWESFCCSVAEAMLCECVPVVSKSAALPEVVGDAGLYLDHLSGDDLAEKIGNALAHPELGKLARRRILDKFPLSKRKTELLKAIEVFDAG